MRANIRRLTRLTNGHSKKLENHVHAMSLWFMYPALADVLHIRDHIAVDSPRYARVVAERLVSSVDRPSMFSLSGRVIPELADPTLGEVIDAPHRMAYRVRDDVLALFTVVHSAQQFPTESLVPSRRGRIVAPAAERALKLTRLFGSSLRSFVV